MLMRGDSRRASMTHRRDVTLADALQRAFHDLPPIESLYKVGEGFGSSVLEVEAGATFMFRLGRHAMSVHSACCGEPPAIAHDGS